MNIRPRPESRVATWGFLCLFCVVKVHGEGLFWSSLVVVITVLMIIIMIMIIVVIVIIVKIVVIPVHFVC